MSGVRMRHPELDEEQIITVAESAVPFHATAGWVVVEDDDSEQAAGDRADSGQVDGGEKPKSGRARASAAPEKKEQD
ncbi:hypothetical protein GCM10023196_035550 [Actinoallomurus vinaceus]|uniref:Uncharacterized protein n=1 Tax=Actinoallomurus vinaceus TaxID=1080074 RepID=A0ABP8UAH5_9ACTN